MRSSQRSELWLLSVERRRRCKGKNLTDPTGSRSSVNSSEVSAAPLQVRQELDLSTALGHQKRSDHGLLHRIHVAHHISVLRSGLLVWLQSGGGHCGVHTRNTTAGITPVWFILSEPLGERYQV